MSPDPTPIDVPSGRPAAVATPAPDDSRLARLSLNQQTLRDWDLPDLVAGCAAAGVPAVGLWRGPVQAHGVERAAALVAEAGLRVSSLCRGGFLTAADPDDRASALDDNHRAIDEAAALDADCLVLVVGGLPDGSRDLPAARDRVATALDELAPHAGEAGVRLALEPLHPMFCADRAVLSTLGQALELAQPHPVDQVGVVVDAYHVWWDPQLAEAVASAGERIASYQVCDWVLPLAEDPLLSRGMMGDGHVDLARLGSLVADAGYTGDIEVEIFNADLWAADPQDGLDTILRRWVQHVVPA